jgi:Xaa-Pro aminopeptidase
MEKAEYAARMERLSQAVASSGADVFLVTGQESIYYLTGASYKPLERPFFIIVWSGSASLLVPQLEQAHMSKAEGFSAVEAYWEYPSNPGAGYMDKLSAMLANANIVGIEPSCKAEVAEQLKSKEVRVLPLVETLRLKKTDAEVAAVRAAAKLADEGIALMRDAAYPGVTPLEEFSVARKLQTKVVMTGVYEPLESEFLTACWPAPYSAQPHSIPPLGAKLGKGPAQMMCFLRANGYAAECERTVFVAPPSEQEAELFGHMLAAREAAFGVVRPGARAADVDAAAREYFAKHGLEKYMLHRVGHGIGLGNHEGPWLSEGSSHMLQESMIVSIEPGLYIPEIGGFRHSDTVLVTTDGYERLTTHPTALQDVMISGAKIGKRLKGALVRKMAKM